MKIIIIILICLFFSLTVPQINEFITNLPQTPTISPVPQTPTNSSPPAQPESGLQAQINILSTSITTTNAIAVEAKKKVDDISSQIEQLKDELKKKPDI